MDAEKIYKKIVNLLSVEISGLDSKIRDMRMTKFPGLECVMLEARRDKLKRFMQELEDDGPDHVELVLSWSIIEEAAKW